MEEIKKDCKELEKKFRRLSFMEKMIGLIAIIMMILALVAVVYGLGGLVFWGIGSFVIWAFGINFVFTFWHGLAIAFIVETLAIIYGR